MALKIENEKIVGTIDNLEEKLDGKIPVTREELLFLANSWGRLGNFYAKASNNQILIIEKCEAKECYNLSKLDVSQIINMKNLFTFSLFNGDISNWDTSNVTNMERMFSFAEKFNQPLNFDTSNVTNMEYMFYNTIKFNQAVNFDTSNITSMERMFAYSDNFNQELNFDTSKVTNMISMFDYAKSFNQPLNFNISNIRNMEDMFYDAKAFELKYNSSKPLPNKTEDIKEWLNDNRDRMNDLDIKDRYGNQIDNFFSNIKGIDNGIKNNK